MTLTVGNGVIGVSVALAKEGYIKEIPSYVKVQEAPGKLGELLKEIVKIASEDKGCLFLPIFSVYSVGGGTEVCILAGAVPYYLVKGRKGNWVGRTFPFEKDMEYVFKVEVVVEKDFYSANGEIVLEHLYRVLLRACLSSGIGAAINRLRSYVR